MEPSPKLQIARLPSPARRSPTPSEYATTSALVSLDMVVEDIFEGPAELVSVSPAPGGDGLWHFSNVAFGECREITLVAKAPNKKQDFKFRMGSMVSGEGFVNVADDYSTAPPSYLLKNCVKAVFYLNNFTVGSYRNCADVLIDDPGTRLSSREHGSGSYRSDETIKLLTENKSIEMKKDVSADHGSTALSLYRNRTVTYSSRWTEEARAKNSATGASMHESYRYAASIDRESRMKLDQNESVMEVESEFQGMGHIGFLKKSGPGRLHLRIRQPSSQERTTPEASGSMRRSTSTAPASHPTDRLLGPVLWLWTSGSRTVKDPMSLGPDLISRMKRSEPTPTTSPRM